eukprot:CAMPEP_0181076914 /NCGR_PEP_ID=MMETSP1071-20121207/670_1 /TAXON_ID=35127 /ORGANISM="Thalassiosira sp., Strain NH16" /LENGTH=379 /DNA_ID=CAMNT_0023158121 /DNA_START=230 /DNA_END=1366 /DNA_ORIENTATION=+
MSLSKKNIMLSNEGGRKKSDIKSFDLEMFHQLRVERLKSQRRAEQLRRERNGQISRLRWNSNASSPSSTINSPININEMTEQRQSVHASIGLFDTNEVDNSARKVLWQLGRRYASQERRALTSLITDHTTTWSSKNERHVESEPMMSPTNESSASPTSEIRQAYPVVENDATGTSPRPLAAISSSYSAPIETPSHQVVGIDAVTPDENMHISKECIGMHGSHYLLLARSHSTASRTMEIEYSENDDNIVVDDEDGSSSASYNTPAPPLQAASACNSHGETGDGPEDHHHSHQKDDAEEKLDHFSSFCRAQVLISEIEHKSSGKFEEASTCTSDDDTHKDCLEQWHKVNAQRLMHCVVGSSAAIIVGAAIYFSWLHAAGW